MFGIIEDERHKSDVEHKLCDLLILVMGAVICGMTEIRDMITYFESSAEFYKERFEIELIPSRSTINRVLDMVDADTVGKIIVKIMCEHTSVIEDILAVDGKAFVEQVRKVKLIPFTDFKRVCY